MMSGPALLASVVMGALSVSSAAACVPVEVAPTTIRLAGGAAFTTSDPAQVHEPIPPLDAAARRLIDAPCFTVQIADAVRLGRLLSTVHTLRRVWTVPVKIRSASRTVALHFTTFRRAPPDHPDHEGGCQRPRVHVTGGTVNLFREDRADHYVLVREPLEPGFSDDKRAALAEAFAPRKPSAPTPAPTKSARPWRPPPPTPDAVVPQNEATAEAIRRWALANAGDEDLRCRSGGVSGPLSLPWSALRGSVLGLSAAGFAPEITGR